MVIGAVNDIKNSQKWKKLAEYRGNQIKPTTATKVPALPIESDPPPYDDLIPKCEDSGFIENAGNKD